MISHSGIALALSACIIPTVARSSSAQARDTVRARLARPVVAVIRTRTVIAVGDTAQLAPQCGGIRAAVDRLGFALEAFPRPAPQVLDHAQHPQFLGSSDLVLG